MGKITRGTPTIAPLTGTDGPSASIPALRACWAVRGAPSHGRVESTTSEAARQVLTSRRNAPPSRKWPTTARTSPFSCSTRDLPLPVAKLTCAGPIQATRRGTRAACDASCTQPGMCPLKGGQQEGGGETGGQGGHVTITATSVASSATACTLAARWPKIATPQLWKLLSRPARSGLRLT